MERPIHDTFFISAAISVEPGQQQQTRDRANINFVHTLSISALPLLRLLGQQTDRLAVFLSPTCFSKVIFHIAPPIDRSLVFAVSSGRRKISHHNYEDYYKFSTFLRLAYTEVLFFLSFEESCPSYPLPALLLRVCLMEAFNKL